MFRRYKVVNEQRVNNTASIRAVESCYGDIRGMFIEDGRFFTDEENRQLARVAVLGYEIKRRLFSQAPAVGREIRIQGVPFQVGVLQEGGHIQLLPARRPVHHDPDPDHERAHRHFSTSASWSGSR